MTSAIIVAAGSSMRMGFDKLFAPLASRPVLAHSIHTFLAHPGIGAVIVVASPGNQEKIIALSPLIRVVPGGTERSQSVWNGLQALSPSCNLVAIHDGARPLIHPASISDALHAARQHGAASLARPITDTLKRASPDGLVTGSVDRSGLWAMETPQCFRTDLLLSAWDRVRHSPQPFTDEVSILEAAGLPVYLVQNLRPNPKITFPPDLDLAAKLLDTSPP